MKTQFKYMLMILALFASALPPAIAETGKIVVQLTRDNENYGHRKAFFQIDKVLDTLGEKNLEVVVVGYENGILAMTQDARTSTMLTKLANRGVKFKACHISMNAWELNEDDFPLEVEFVPAGAPEMIKLQLDGYIYWKP